MKKQSVLVLLVVILIATPAAAFHAKPDHIPKITVMSWNVYVGTDLFAVLDGPPEEFPARLMHAVQNVIASDIPARANAIAKQIRVARPAVICLQEMYRIEIPGQPVFDFKALILDQLHDYKEVVTNPLTHIVLPFGPGWLQVQDRDVILARRSVEVFNTETVIFDESILLPVPLPAPSSSYSLRGMSKALIGHKGATYLIANAHLEIFSPLREAQAQAVVQALEGEPGPVILAGDFNDEPGTLTYEALLAGGFKDMWPGRMLGRRDKGFTCCQDEDLLNFRSALDQRIDYIFVRNQANEAGDNIAATLLGLVVGDRQFNKTRTRPRLWPSDHGGVYMILMVPALD